MISRLALWALLAAAGWGYAFWVYRRRELSVPGRNLLALLRGSAVALVLLLLLDFPIPGSSTPGEVWILVDTSSSMAVAAGTGGEGVPDAGGPTRGFGGPGDSRLAPALTRALEAGARRVEVVTDLRIQDPAAVEALLARSPVPVEIRDVGGEVRNAGVAEVALPMAVRSGETASGTVTLFGEPGAPVALTLTPGAAPRDTTVRLPESGRLRVPVRFVAPDAPGAVAVTARVTLEGDAVPGDDRRSAVVSVDPVAGELVLVSWVPDWEPRFLLPTLEEVTGLQGQGWLRVGPDRFISMRGPRETLAEVEVRRRVADARVAVLHAPPLEEDSALAGVVARAPRVVTLPGSVTPGGASGEWFLAPDVPPSPLAGELAGVPLLGLPPLAGVREDSGGGRPVLLAQRGGRGEARPVLVLREAAEGRRVEALAHGFWRWQMREGASRDLYRRLWSGTAGWLLAERSRRERAVGIAPLTRVLAPGAPVPWRAGAAAGGMLEVRLDPEGDPETEPSVLAVDSLGGASGRAPEEPGVYRWEARPLGDEAPEAVARGLLVVEAGDLDLLPTRAVSLSGAAGGDQAAVAATRRPLRTHPVPYLLLLGLLSPEWILRRRRGLR